MIIKDIQKNKTQIIRVEISEYKEKKYLNIRTWYKVDENDEEYKPSNKGIAINIEKYNELKDAILESEKHLK